MMQPRAISASKSASGSVEIGVGDADEPGSLQLLGGYATSSAAGGDVAIVAGGSATGVGGSAAVRTVDAVRGDSGALLLSTGSAAYIVS